MNNTVTVALAQLDLVVGDVKGNTERILESAVRARDELHADLVVFPELSICGYPPEDLLFHAGLRHAVERSLEDIRSAVTGIAVLVGFPEYQGDEIFNSCAVSATASTCVTTASAACRITRSSTKSDTSRQANRRRSSSSTASASASTSARTSGARRPYRRAGQPGPRS